MAGTIDNFVTVTGNVTRDPELRFTQGGVPLAQFGVAWNARRRTEDGKWEDGEVSFFDVVCWRGMAENVAESVVKGQRVVVTGRLRQNTWENEAGEKRSKVEIQADEVAPSLLFGTTEFTKGAGGGGGGGGGSFAPPPDEEPF